MNFKFVGREGYYREGELYLLGQRWYDSSVGRFISRDIITDTNLYWYSNNNPLNFIDPQGMSAIPFPIHITCPVPVSHPVCFILAGIIICYCRPGHNFPGRHLVYSETIGYKEIKISFNGHCFKFLIPIKECAYDCYDWKGDYYKHKIEYSLGICSPYLLY